VCRACASTVGGRRRVNLRQGDERSPLKPGETGSARDRGVDCDYAIVTIAHRLSMVKNADRIYPVEEVQIMGVVKRGELVDNGGK